MPYAERLPVPYISADENLRIIVRSAAAALLFPEEANLLDLVDPESRIKAERLLNPDAPEVCFEAALRTNEEPLVLFELRASWDEQRRLHLVLLQKEERLQEVIGHFEQLRARLATTDLALLARKDELERTITRLEESAADSDKLAILGKMAAGIAHEIRNPLTIIRGFVQLLQPVLDEAGKTEYGKVVLSEIDRANDIIQEFLSSSKPLNEEQQKVSISSLFNEILLLCQSEATLKGCEISLAPLPQQLPVVRMNTKQIKQVLLNLIKNAIEAVSEHPDAAQRPPGLIRLEARQQGSAVQLLISDNGMGMDEQTLAKLFDPFFTTKAKGTGLGLAVCQRIVQSHQGSLHVESVLGEGTTFRIHLPLHR